MRRTQLRGSRRVRGADGRRRERRVGGATLARPTRRRPHHRVSVSRGREGDGHRSRPCASVRRPDRRGSAGTSYLSFRQGAVLPMYLVYRTSASPALAVPGIRAALGQADPSRSVTLDDISTLDAKFALVVARPRFYLILVSAFAAIAFLLATVGIHGTLSFWANERRREMGIRLALGAAHTQIRSLIVRRGLMSAGLGITLGSVGYPRRRTVYRSIALWREPRRSGRRWRLRRPPCSRLDGWPACRQLGAPRVSIRWMCCGPISGNLGPSGGVN